MAKKKSKVETLEDQLREAVKVAGMKVDQSSDFGRGEYAGIHTVMVELSRIRRRDAEMAEDGIARGSM